MSNSLKFLDAMSTATECASKSVALHAQTISKARQAGSIRQETAGALAELMRLAGVVGEIDSETRTAARLVAAAPQSVRAVAVNAANSLRQSGQTASTAAGKIEAAYRAGSESVLESASLSNTLRAATCMIYAISEAARQLDVLAGKIKT